MIPDDIYNLSEQEVIKILQENGIQVVMKPVALVSDNLMLGADGYNTTPIFKYVDIYEVLNQLNACRAVAISHDPFS